MDTYYRNGLRYRQAPRPTPIARPIFIVGLILSLIILGA